MDSDQTAPDLGLHCLTKRPLKHFSKRKQQTSFVVIGALRVNLNDGEFCICKKVKMSFINRTVSTMGAIVSWYLQDKTIVVLLIIITT